MKDKPSLNNYNRSDNKNPPSDPIKTSEKTPGIYSPDEYKIPEQEKKTWCSYMERGFRASINVTDKQPGTHTETAADVIEEKILRPEELKK
jgi:hypothetical protein